MEEEDSCHSSILMVLAFTCKQKIHSHYRRGNATRFSQKLLQFINWSQKCDETSCEKWKERREFSVIFSVRLCKNVFSEKRWLWLVWLESCESDYERVIMRECVRIVIMRECVRIVWEFSRTSYPFSVMQWSGFVPIIIRVPPPKFCYIKYICEVLNPNLIIINQKWISGKNGLCAIWIFFFNA